MPKMNRIAKIVVGLGTVAAAVAITAAPAAASLATDTEERMLAAHNQYRMLVSQKPLKWDESLAADAQQWADRLLSARDIAHDPNLPQGMGENLFRTEQTHANLPDPVRAVRFWGDEGQWARHEPIQAKWAHWAQIVYKNATKVGCAVAEDGDTTGLKTQVVVCRYDEAPLGGYPPF